MNALNIPVTFFFSYAADTKREETLSLNALAERIRNTTQREKARLPWLKLARFGDAKSDKGSLRHDANLSAIVGIEADYDGERMPFEEACERLLKAGVRAIAYTSPSHKPAKPRWRVLCPLSAEYPPEQRARFLGRLNGLFGGIFSDESWTLSQSYYFGSVKRNPAHGVEIIDGTAIDLHDELDETWTGKPDTKPTGKAGNGADHAQGAVNMAGLLRAIRDGRDYHRAMIRVMGKLARTGTPASDARALIVEAMESVFPPDRDARWQDRLSDLDRCLHDIYGKEAERRWQDEPPPFEPEPEAEPRQEKAPGRDDPSDDEEASEKPALRLRYGFDATHAEPLGTVIKGLLHAGSVTLIYGPPKSGKSFLATDLALAVASEQPDWMGHIITRPGPILYVACEGHAGSWKRLAAAAKQRGWNEASFPKGFILATGRPTLIRMEVRGMTYAPDPSSILAALADAKRRGLNPVGIVIDTVFRSFGAGNVNASPDMNVYLASVAVLTDQGYAVALVHHEIKSGGTPAGSVSLTGGSDTILHVWRENETGARRFWQIEMAKDDAETEPRAFTLEVVSIGLDPDGQPAASCVIRDGGAAPDATAKKKRGRPPSENSDAAILANLIHTELCNLLADDREGQDVCIHPEAPPIRAVSRSRLRGSINQAGILDPVPDGADRQRVQQGNDRDVKRAINRLKKQGKVAANEHWIGLCQ